MGFRKPITTAGGLLLWNCTRQDTYFILQEHKVGIPIWPYKYRILMRENRMEIANSNNVKEIDLDWEYLQHHVVPQLDKKIDIYEKIEQSDVLAIVMKTVGIFL